MQNVFIGNPELDPEYTDAIELGFTHQADWGSLQLSPFYRHTTDVIRFIVDTDDVVDGREVTSVSFENLDSGNSWGTDVNGSYEYGGWLSGFGDFNVFKMVTEGGSATSLVVERGDMVHAPERHRRAHAVAEAAGDDHVSRADGVRDAASSRAAR